MTESIEEALRRENALLHHERVRLETALEKEREEKAELEKKYQQLKGLFQNYLAQIELNEERIESLLNYQRERQVVIDRLVRENQQLEQDLKRLKASFELPVADCQIMAEELDKKNEEIEAHKAQIELLLKESDPKIKSLEKTIKSLKQEKDQKKSLEQALNALKEKLETAESKLEESKNASKAQQVELEALKNEITELRAQRERDILGLKDYTERLAAGFSSSSSSVINSYEECRSQVGEGGSQQAEDRQSQVGDGGSQKAEDPQYEYEIVVRNTFFDVVKKEDRGVLKRCNSAPGILQGNDRPSTTPQPEEGFIEPLGANYQVR